MGWIWAAVAIAAAALLAAWGGWAATRPRPDLARARTLAELRRFDEAETQARWYLRAHPGSSPAHMLLAQILLNRLGGVEPHQGQLSDPRPAQEALEHLRQVQPDNPILATLAKLYQGKAEYRLARLDAAEASWSDALRIEPRVPEAGWALLELYYLEGRGDDARRLALRLFEVEPDPHDRAQLLLELVRQDAQPLAPGSVVQWFEPLVERNPNDLHASLALGLALVHAGEIDRGLARLQAAAERRPHDADAWDAWLTGLDDAGQIDGLDEALARLPATLADAPRFAKHRARVAQERADWPAAVRDYRRAVQAAPRDHRLEYRLIRALRNAGEPAEADRLDHGYRAYVAASKEVRDVYDEANAVKTLGVQPHPELCERIADLRARLGLADEASAWRRLARGGRESIHR
jgi:tetratricopeptide (TPR) repeat protein